MVVEYAYVDNADVKADSVVGNASVYISVSLIFLYKLLASN